ncbi:hypothetical protein DFJ77DRAFT_455528 [Powellomyces hirtus]|nr:hypothetical protein DFJ77DRAFT_455528 [Powellomyces hirtus]
MESCNTTLAEEQRDNDHYNTCRSELIRAGFDSESTYLPADDAPKRQVICDPLGANQPISISTHIPPGHAKYKPDVTFLMHENTIGPTCISIKRDRTSTSRLFIHVRTRYGFHTCELTGEDIEDRTAAAEALRQYFTLPWIHRPLLKEGVVFNPAESRAGDREIYEMAESVAEHAVKAEGTMADRMLQTLEPFAFRKQDYVVVDVVILDGQEPAEHNLQSRIESILGVPGQEFILPMDTCEAFTRLGLKVTTRKPLTSAPTPLHSTTTVDEHKRQGLMKEIIATERSYISKLQKLESQFVQPVVANALGLGFTGEQDVLTRFPSVHALIEQSQDLLGELSSNQNTDVMHIATVFANTLGADTPIGKTYVEYLKKHIRIPAFTDEMQKFLRQCEENGQNTGLDYDNLRIEPVQRPARYTMTLREMLRITPSDNPEYEILQKAYAAAEELVGLCQAVQAKREEEKFPYELDKALNTKGKLAQPGLHYLCEIMATLRDERNKDVVVSLVLCNTCILVIRGKTAGSPSKIPRRLASNGADFMHVYPLDHTTIIDRESKVFRIHHAPIHSDLIFEAHDLDDKKFFLRAVRNAGVLMRLTFSGGSQFLTAGAAKQPKIFARRFMDTDIYFNVSADTAWKHEGNLGLVVCDDIKNAQTSLIEGKPNYHAMGVLQFRDGKSRVQFGIKSAQKFTDCKIMESTTADEDGTPELDLTELENELPARVHAVVRTLAANHCFDRTDFRNRLEVLLGEVCRQHGNVGTTSRAASRAASRATSRTSLHSIITPGLSRSGSSHSLNVDAEVTRHPSVLGGTSLRKAGGGRNITGAMHMFRKVSTALDSWRGKKNFIGDFLPILLDYIEKEAPNKKLLYQMSSKNEGVSSILRVLECNPEASTVEKIKNAHSAELVSAAIKAYIVDKKHHVIPPKLREEIMTMASNINKRTTIELQPMIRNAIYLHMLQPRQIKYLSHVFRHFHRLSKLNAAYLPSKMANRLSRPLLEDNRSTTSKPTEQRNRSRPSEAEDAAFALETMIEWAEDIFPHENLFYQRPPTAPPQYPVSKRAYMDGTAVSAEG